MLSEPAPQLPAQQGPIQPLARGSADSQDQPGYRERSFRAAIPGQTPQLPLLPPPFTLPPFPAQPGLTARSALLASSGDRRGRGCPGCFASFTSAAWGAGGEKTQDSAWSRRPRPSHKHPGKHADCPPRYQRGLGPGTPQHKKLPCEQWELLHQPAAVGGCYPRYRPAVRLLRTLCEPRPKCSGVAGQPNSSGVPAGSRRGSGPGTLFSTSIPALQALPPPGPQMATKRGRGWGGV